MQRPKEPPSSCLKKTKQQETPVSTTVQLPAGSELKASANATTKTICIKKLVNKYLKEIDSERRLCKIIKSKHQNRTLHRPAGTPGNNQRKPSPSKKVTSTRKPIHNLKIRHEIHVTTRKKCNSKSTRRRVQTTASVKAAHSVSLTRKAHPSSSIDPHHSEDARVDSCRSDSYESRKQPNSCKTIKGKLEENPFSIYLKSFRNIRF